MPWGFLFVPLGDLMERRRLLRCFWQLLSLWEVRSVSQYYLVVGASLVIGMTTIAAQLIVPFAAQLAKPKEQGCWHGDEWSADRYPFARAVSGFVGASLAGGQCIGLPVV